MDLKTYSRNFSAKDRCAVFFFANINGIGPVSLREIMSAFADNNISPAEFLTDSSEKKERRIIGGEIRKKINTALPGYPEFLDNIETAEKDNIFFRLFYEDNYPPFLEYYNPGKSPSALVYHGNENLLNKPLAAIVGSRHTTEWGVKNTGKIASMLSERGVVVVSGAADGIDSAAHKGAMEKGGSVFVPAEPLERFICSNKFGGEIGKSENLILSPFLPWSEYLGSNPIIRNDIVADLAALVIIGECGMKSGTNYVIRSAMKKSKSIYALTDYSDINNIPDGNRAILNNKGIPIDVSEKTDLSEIMDKIADEAYRKFSEIKEKFSSGLNYLSEKTVQDDLPLNFD